MASLNLLVEENILANPLRKNKITYYNNAIITY